MEDSKEIIIQHLRSKIATALKDVEVITVNCLWECAFRRPEKHPICACNLPGHCNCPDADGKWPAKCPLYKGPVRVIMGKEADRATQVRSDEGQVREGGDGVRRGADEGGAHLPLDKAQG